MCAEKLETGTMWNFISNIAPVMSTLVIIMSGCRWSNVSKHLDEPYIVVQATARDCGQSKDVR